MAWIYNSDVRNLVDDLHHKTLVEIAEDIVALRDQVAEQDATIDGLHDDISDLKAQLAKAEGDA